MSLIDYSGASIRYNPTKGTFSRFPTHYLYISYVCHRVSKRIMSESGVPVVPGYFGEEQSDSRLKEEADKMG